MNYVLGRGDALATTGNRATTVVREVNVEMGMIDLPVVQSKGQNGGWWPAIENSPACWDGVTYESTISVDQMDRSSPLTSTKRVWPENIYWLPCPGIRTNAACCGSCEII